MDGTLNFAFSFGGLICFTIPVSQYRCLARMASKSISYRIDIEAYLICA